MGFIERMEELATLDKAGLEQKNKEIQKEFKDILNQLTFQQSEDLIDLFILYGNCNWRLGLGK